MTGNFSKQTLKNGVRLLLIPVPGAESIGTAVFVGVGSRYETPKINGISHFLEHMVFKGTQKYPTTDDVNEIERIGGIQNAYTDIDVTKYHNKVLAEDWRLALEINKELALTPRLEEQYVDKERNVIIEEMKRYEDEPAAKVEEAFHAMLYPQTKLGMRIIGEERSLKEATSKTLSDYHKTWYTPDRMVVVLAGKIGDQDQKEMSAQVEEWFGGLSGTSGRFEAVNETQTGPQMAVVTKKEAQQAHLEIGVRTFERSSTDRFAWSVFNLLMGVSFTSRLFREVREKRGLCYHIRSGSANYADVGAWSIYAGVATDKVEEATQAVMTELTKVVQDGVSEEEVAVAKKRLKTILAFKAEDPEFFGEFYGRPEVFGEPIVSFSEYLTKVDAIGVADINALVRRYITTKTLNMALVWSKPKDEKLLEVLKV